MRRYLYSLLFYLAVPFLLVRLLLKSLQNPFYRRRLLERFGYFKVPSEMQGAIWIHAVSVGETIATIPLIKHLQAVCNKPIVLTTTTPTGSERVQAIFETSVFHVYLPYDLPFAVKRFLRLIKPAVGILMETELWPNYLYYCHAQHIPVFLANARLSEKSMRGYRLFPTLTRTMLSQINCIAAQSKQDALRFIALGADSNNVKITGSMKFDIHVPASIQEKGTVFRRLWGEERPVWIAASTHEGEEELILNALKQIKLQLPHILLVLVPRHPERFDKVAQLCQKRGFRVIKRSENKACTLETDIFLGDSMGELLAQYAGSDLAFVGGSLVPVGGHNLLEPAALGKAAMTGPHVFNFLEITQLLANAGAVVIVSAVMDVVNEVISFLTDPQKLAAAGAEGKQVVLQNKGAVKAHGQLLEQLLALC